MSELTDDQLDGLFRKSAEENDPPFDPAAWQDMKIRLDAHDRTLTGGTPIWTNLLRWGLPIVLLLLLTGGGWYVNRKVTQPDAEDKTRSVAAVPQSTLPTATQPNSSATTRLSDASPEQKKPDDLPEKSVGNVHQPTVSVEPVLKRSIPDNGQNESVVEVREENKPDVADATNEGALAYKVKAERSRIARPRLAASTAATRYEREMTDRSNGIVAGQFSARKQTRKGPNRLEKAYSVTRYSVPTIPSFGKQPLTKNSASERIRADNTIRDTEIPEIGETESVTLPTLNTLPIRPAQWSKALAFTGRPVLAQPDTVTRRVVPKPAAMRGLSVRVMVAPDLSAIGLKNFTRPGTNVGMMLEHRLASRWSVQAGIIQSTKIYKARTNEYKLPPYTSTWKVRPESVEGQCNMLDIPINVRYDIVLRPRLDGRPPSRLFVSGGVTSYIIKQEDYTYTYADPTNSHIYSNMRGWTSKDKDVTTNFGFSQLNLSAGYERAINKRLSWQVEPFLKAPLRGVGYLNINLLSTGAFFSLRYKL